MGKSLPPSYMPSLAGGKLPPETEKKSSSENSPLRKTLSGKLPPKKVPPLTFPHEKFSPGKLPS